MASWRSSFALDLLADRDLIERLVGLQEEKRASDVIRTALRQYFDMEPSLADLLEAVQEVKALLLNMKVVENVGQEPKVSLDVDVDELESRLNTTLSKFG